MGEEGPIPQSESAFPTKQSRFTLYDNIKGEPPSAEDLRKFSELPRGMLLLEVIIRGIEQSDKNMLAWGLRKLRARIDPDNYEKDRNLEPGDILNDREIELDIEDLMINRRCTIYVGTGTLGDRIEIECDPKTYTGAITMPIDQSRSDSFGLRRWNQFCSDFALPPINTELRTEGKPASLEVRFKQDSFIVEDRNVGSEALK